MAMLLKSKNQAAAVLVPDGTYKAVLTKVSGFENAYGQRVGFEFTLKGKGVDGLTVLRSTNPVLSMRSKLAEVIEGMLGRNLSYAEVTTGMDVELLVGSECSALVINSKSKNGGMYSNVERIFQA
jgi:hypothetical protein